MMERYFSKGYFLAEKDKRVQGIVGWQAENLVAGIDDFFIRDAADWLTIGAQLLDAVENAATELSCEVGLLFLPAHMVSMAKPLWQKKGYQPQKTNELTKIWREAADDWQEEDTVLLVKKYLKKRINVPL